MKMTLKNSYLLNFHNHQKKLHSILAIKNKEEKIAKLDKLGMMKFIYLILEIYANKKYKYNVNIIFIIFID